MRRKAPDEAQVTELILQAVETERGGIEIHTAAIKAATIGASRAEQARTEML